MNIEQKEISGRVIFNEFFRDGLFHIQVMLDGKVLGQMSRGKPKSLKDYIENQLVKDREDLLNLVIANKSFSSQSVKATLSDRVQTDSNIHRQTFKEFLHNGVGHPLLAICNAFGAYKTGSWIHDVLFKF